MLSILIPTYNYNAYPLAKKLSKQALDIGLIYELICIDDGSFAPINKENQRINEINSCSFLENKTNLGRAATRQTLASKAQYNWLLFLDADVMPKYDTFLKTLKPFLNFKNKLVFGGIAYNDSCPEHNYKLRWHYGKNREQTTLSYRKKHPYTSIISGALAIEKEAFIITNAKLTENKYGLDIQFSTLLKRNRIQVLHIDNPVLHLGIEDNKTYLMKAKQALDTLFCLVHSENISKSQTTLLKVYNKLNSLRLAHVFGTISQYFNVLIERNLLGASPNLILFDLYRLGYYCRLNNKKDA